MRTTPKSSRRQLSTWITVGLIAGLTLALVWPSSYRSEIGVFIARAEEARGDGALEREARFVNAEPVRSAVRASIPNAPDEIGVTTDRERRLLRLQAAADTPDEALRLVRTWATAFLDERAAALTTALTDRTTILEEEIDTLVTRIGEARLRGDESEIERLQSERDVAAAERVRTLNELTALEQGSTAEVVEDAALPTEPTGIQVIPALGIGGVLGAIIGLVATWRADRIDRRDEEAKTWLPLDDETPLSSWALLHESADTAPSQPPRSVSIESTASTSAEPRREPVATPHQPQPVIERRRPHIDADQRSWRRGDGRIRITAQPLDEPLRVATIRASAHADGDAGD